MTGPNTPWRPGVPPAGEPDGEFNTLDVKWSIKQKISFEEYLLLSKYTKGTGIKIRMEKQ